MMGDRFIRDIQGIVGKKQVLTDAMYRIAYGADAGCYSKLPELVVLPETEHEVSTLLNRCRRDKMAVTFRAAGTSLSGQAISDAVLMVASGDRWSDIKVLDGGRRVKVQPGITGSRLNLVLKNSGMKFGPDPASINSAKIGGIIANNASGMSCGTHSNSYSTIQSARIVFSDGRILDTADESSKQQFKTARPELIDTIHDIRQKIMKHPELPRLIREKYSIKNTCGYGMNSFVDYEDPFDIILHLMVGSEGTLGFISEAVFHTVPVQPERASSLIFFKSLAAACRAVPMLKDARVSAIELMDRQALRSVENKEGIPAYIREFDDNVAALLIDLEAANEIELEALIASTEDATRQLELARDYKITKDPKQILGYWNIRKGVFPSVGAMRKPGTAVIIEDIAVRLECLEDAVADLRRMLDNLAYNDAVIYGHALDGNLHFIFAQDFEDEVELSRYSQLIRSLVELVVDKYNGSLKAEHGTGINMAPFVRYEWGDEIYEMMKRVKQAFDPEGILNPGVMISDDPDIHLKSFKSLPVIDKTVDKCIECGFCEINCLSTGYTLSARQRIVVQRELANLRSQGRDMKLARKIENDFRYAGDITCATDGLCAISCPVDIDTGVYIKRLREERIGKKGDRQPVAGWIAKHFILVKQLMRSGLQVISYMHRIMGSRLFGAIAGAARKISFGRIPQWNRYMPTGVHSKTRPAAERKGNLKVVYFPSCINQVMGPALPDHQNRPLKEVTEDVLTRAGYEVIYPENMQALCCGTPWESKGFASIADASSSALEKRLLEASKNGEYPVLCDTSPCIYRMKRVMDKRLRLYEPVEFIHDFLLDHCSIEKIPDPVAFHITCSSIKMGIDEKFHAVASACVEDPYFPEEVGCCGFAGDKGFSVPELNAWALRKLNLDHRKIKRGYSNSRTCEIGLSKNSGVSYESVMFLLDKVMC